VWCALLHVHKQHNLQASCCCSHLCCCMIPLAGRGYSPEWRARAISLTVGCAVFGAAIGPELTRHVRNELPRAYTGESGIITTKGANAVNCLYAAGLPVPLPDC
jgi:hypothetical protein